MHRRSLSFALACALAILVLAAIAQRRPASSTSQNRAIAVTARLNTNDIIQQSAIRVARMGIKSDGADAVARDPAGEAYLIMNMEFDSEANRKAYAVAGAPVFASADRYADAFVPVSDASALAPQIDKVPGLVRIAIADRVAAPPAPKPGNKASRGEPEPIVRGGLSGLTGKGVIIAIVDSGLDFRNKDFIRYEDGKPVSRLLYLWDTTSGDFDAGRGGSRAPIRYPNGASVGTVYTRDQLTQDLRGASSVIGNRDLNGHGTSCAGIAAGNGNNLKRNIGVAPNADIIGIRIGGTASGGLDFAWTLNAACEWLDQVAGSTPLVVSCSFGGHAGPHDGTSIEEQHLSSRFTDQTRSRALCVAAGNEGNERIHAEVTLGSSSKPAELKWKSGPGASLSLIFSTSDMSTVRFRPAPGVILPKLKASVNPHTRQASVPIPITGVGEGSMQIFTSGEQPVQCDAYISGGAFDTSCSTFSKLVGKPGTAAGAITIGSYDWNDRFEHKDGPVVVSPEGKPMIIGGLSSYSSVGPSRDPNITKPDLVAPGQFYSAPAPLDETDGMRDASGNYQIFNGTSAATPYTAGVIALMFERKPGLTYGDIRNLLRRSLSSDAYTGSAPNPRWGYGKLDLAAVRRLLAAIE
ncbi:MAG: S8 family serine peptidase [Chthonomonadales bacterium]|nr:S8 family serine peptidase [Chthonomonadales bacterium]